MQGVQNTCPQCVVLISVMGSRLHGSVGMHTWLAKCGSSNIQGKVTPDQQGQLQTAGEGAPGPNQSRGILFSHSYGKASRTQLNLRPFFLYTALALFRTSLK